MARRTAFYCGLLCLTLITCIQSTLADTTWVAGSVSGEWTAAGNPYIVTDTVRINANDSLVIGPGVQILMMQRQHHGLHWYIDGDLYTYGTERDSVTFSAINDSAYWWGLRFQGMNTRFHLNYTAFRQACNAIVTDSIYAGVQIRHCSIVDYYLQSSEYSLIYSLRDSVILSDCDFAFCNRFVVGGYFRVESTRFQARNLNDDQGPVAIFGQGALIRNCRFEGFDGSTLLIGGSGGEMTVDNCLFDLNGYWSDIAVTQNVAAPRHINIVNNTFVGSKEYKIEYTVGVNELVTISNNIFTDTWDSAILVWGEFHADHYQITNNCFWNNTYNFQVLDTLFSWPKFGALTRINCNEDSTDVYGNLFMEPLFDGSFEYGLAEDSPCIDAGIDVGLPFTGVAPDLGYMEFGLSHAEKPRSGFFPDNITLSAYPNPFNPTTRIAFTLPMAGYVDLNVYDVTGRLVRCLIGRTQGSPLQAGEHQILFDGEDLPSGIYFARMQAGRLRRHEKWFC